MEAVDRRLRLEKRSEYGSDKTKEKKERVGGNEKCKSP